jgi:hypothetical protein
VRAIVEGFVLMVALSVIVLSIKPGGLRRQLRLAARRLRLVLLFGGVYLVLSTAIRVFFPVGWVSDYGPIVVALVLAVALLVVAQDPALPPEPKS